MDKLFSNPGHRIKTWAKVLFTIEAVLVILGGLFIMIENEDPTVLLAVVGALIVAFISALFLYAFGELVESSQENRDINRRILVALNNAEPKSAPAAGVWHCRSCGNAVPNAFGFCNNCGSPKA